MGSFNVAWPLSFTYVIYDLPLEAHCQKKKTRFLSFISSSSSLPSEVKGTLWRSFLCYFILFFSFCRIILFHLALFRCPLHHLSPRRRTLLMIEISQGVKDLSLSSLLHCLSGQETVIAQTRTQMLWMFANSFPPPAPGRRLAFSVAMTTWCHICVRPPLATTQGTSKPPLNKLGKIFFSSFLPPPFFLISDSRRWNPAVSITGPY